MTSPELLAAFDHALDALAAGESLQAVAARQGALAGELRPMLEAAEAARQLGAQAQVPRAAQLRSRAQFLETAAARQARSRAAGAWAFARRAVTTSLAVVVAVALGAYALLSLSAGSLPGEPLYGLKRGLEDAQVLLAADSGARADLEAHFADRRLAEVERLLAQGRTAAVTFGGTLNSLDGERWQVAGLTVVVPPGAEVNGAPLPGLYVEVTGATQPDGTIVAERVDVTGLMLYGPVRSRGAELWQVGDTVLRVSDATRIAGNPAEGDWVTVLARPLSTGGLLALEIAPAPPAPVIEGTATPAPSPTPERQATSTDAPPTESTPALSPTPRASPAATANPSTQAPPTLAPTSTVSPPTDAPDVVPTNTQAAGGEPGPSPSNTPEPEDDDNENDNGNGSDDDNDNDNENDDDNINSNDDGDNSGPGGDDDNGNDDNSGPGGDA